MATAAVSLLTGLWAGLVRLGLDLPTDHGGLAEVHGPLMVLGFLGTVISLERAVALGAAWGYAAPSAAAAGTRGRPARAGHILGAGQG